MLVNVSTEIPEPLAALGSGSSTLSTVPSASSSSAQSADWDSPIHPFASSTAKLEIIPSSATSHIDVEEEARLYDELCRNYEEDTASVSFLFFYIAFHWFLIMQLFYSLQNLFLKIDIPFPLIKRARV